MFASIQSIQFPEFYCRVKAEPVREYSDAKVFELVDSSVPNDIVKRVGGRLVGVYRHVAIDNQGFGYLYDYEKETQVGHIGPCSLTFE